MNVIVDPYWSKPTRCYNSFLFFFFVLYILIFAQAHLHINMYSLTIHLFIKEKSLIKYNFLV